MANLCQPSENENPGALAGATGADQLGKSFKSEQYRNRAESATALCHAIAACDRDDACEIMTAALASLSFGPPAPVFLSALNDARWWASLASPHEVKAFALACFEAMRPKVQASFLGYARGRTAA